MKPIARLLLGLALASATTACRDSSWGTDVLPPPPPPPPLQPASLEQWHGHLVGTATIAGESYEVEGLLTVDRTLRLLVKSSVDAGAQLISHLEVQDDRAEGSGVIVGQGCGTTFPSRFCGETAAVAALTFTSAGSFLYEGVAGHVHVSTAAGEETWSLDLEADPGLGYAEPASAFDDFMRGTLTGLEPDLIELRVEIDGRVSLNGGDSGCTGAGTLIPHLDGQFNVYDVALTLQGCDPAHASLNGSFEGFATHLPSSPWGGGADVFNGYDEGPLQMWLSTLEGAPAPVAVTIVASSGEALTKAWQGYYSGSVTNGGEDHYAEALLTVDGDIRIYIARTTGPVSYSVGSAQFIGTVVSQAGSISGNGVLVGQGCAIEPGRFCGQAAVAAISITAGRPDLVGEMRVATSAGPETWSFTMSWPTDTYLEPAALEFAQGVYRESAAEFAAQGDVVESVDAGGRLFFQSAASGCTANGELAPHLDGKFNVYDVTLVMESCNGTYAYLNGDFKGLATRSVDYWGYWGDWLVIWLSRPGGSTSDPVAVTLWGDRS